MMLALGRHARFPFFPLASNMAAVPNAVPTCDAAGKCEQGQY